MKAIIGCEESQAVCIRLRELGHEAYSCDYQECSGGRPEWHIQMDIMEALDLDKWEFFGLHPTCTKITVAGNRTYAFGKPKYPDRLESIEWTISLWNKATRQIKRGYMENPIGALNTDSRLPKPQIVQPYNFGDMQKKATCLWLHNLPKLIHTTPELKPPTDPEELKKWEMIWRMPPGPDRPKLRSKTFPGIATAIATQWAEKQTDPTHIHTKTVTIILTHFEHQQLYTAT